MNNDLSNGMYFDSTIPQGYGVGSSGALVAAFYDRYAINKFTVLENLTRDKILHLKNIFSLMESFFHGKSSGLDPLNSYLSLPILIHSKDQIETTGIPLQSSNGKGAVFLIDSGESSETAPMVDIFFKSMLNSGRLLEIENDKLRTEIESIYTKHEERVNGLTNFTKINSDKIGNWFEKKRNKYNSDINFGDVFLKERDQELKNLLKDKKATLGGRIVDLEFYLQSLQNVVSIISNDYKTVN